MSLLRRAGAAGLVLAAVGAVLAVPAGAHEPRGNPDGSPRMDLEVMVTPELSGRLTPGGTDSRISVDGFGNRFAVARKEDVQTAVGVDQRARTATRAAAWSWVSSDEGRTWDNLETVTRGLDGFVPQGSARDVASGASVTLVGEALPAVVLVRRVVATSRGRLTPSTPVAVPVTVVAEELSLATDGRTALLAVVSASTTTTARSSDGGATWAPGPALEGRCDVSTAPAARRVAHAACLVGDRLVLRTSRDAGASWTSRALGSADSRIPETTPSVDTGPDGAPHVLSGMTLLRERGGRVLSQNLATRPGRYAGASLSVSNRGRLAVGAYRQSAPNEPWTVETALFTPGKRPVWFGFADHDPTTVAGAAAPASVGTSVDTDPQGRLQLTWAATYLHSEELGRPLLRNVFTIRSNTT